MGSINRNPVVVIFLISNFVFAYLVFSYLLGGGGGKGYRRTQGLKKSTPRPKATSPLVFREYNIEELKSFNGVDEERILMAVKGEIFDVTSAKAFYGPGGAYSGMAGRDASRSLATQVVPEFNANHIQKWDDLDNLSEDEGHVLSGWIEFYRSKYPIVGRLIRGQEDSSGSKDSDIEELLLKLAGDGSSLESEYMEEKREP